MTSFLVAVLAGGVLGALFGDRIMPADQGPFGQIFNDFVFAVGGAFRIGVLHDGRIVELVDRERADLDRIGLAMACSAGDARHAA